MNLKELGWNDYFLALFEEHKQAHLFPARVIAQHRERSRVVGEQGELNGHVSGRFRHQAQAQSDYPTVGDWVACASVDGEQAVIHALLPRQSAFTRKVAGEETEAQVVAANIDTLFLVTGLDNNFNLRRIERYLTTAWDSGASPVIVLNKADLCSDLDSLMAEVDAIALGTPVVTVSALNGFNVETLRTHLEPGKTCALLGSSGVGKSSLINRLLGEDRMAVKETRVGDSRGRHTTTHRELIRLPDGALLIDTPGMRELALWADDESIGTTFEDIENLACECRFKDCAHESEPGCAVLEAVEKGAIDASRLESYHKQLRELRFLERKQDKRALRQQQKARGKQIASIMRDLKKRKPGFQ